jgi:acetyl-CoA C-acetyltransferase
VHRPTGDLRSADGPIELMANAARLAVEEAGCERLLARIGWIGVAGGFWRYKDPGALVGTALGCSPVRTAVSSISGSAPQELLGRAAELIAGGEIEVALVVGGEARYTTERLKKSGEPLPWPDEPGEGSPEKFSGFPEDPVLFDEFRMFGAAAPAYALMSDSLRVAEGESIDENRDVLAGLWAGFSAVAATNPHAWDRSAHTTADIREPRPDNRMIAFPYTKAMVANNTVDMASAIVLCSVAVARELGIDDERLVFPHVITKAHETWLVVNRHELHGSPALTAAGLAALGHAGIEASDVEHVDLYACFPVIVRMSARALGFGSDRPLTVTGGLGFAGAAIGNAVGHSIAAMVPLLRAGGWGVIHGNGGNATKHSFGVYSNQPPDHFVLEDCQQSIDLQARPTLDPTWAGAATVEASTVVFDRSGPSHVLAAVRPVGPLAEHRGWATSKDDDVIQAAMTSGLAGSTIRRTATGEIA